MKIIAALSDLTLPTSELGKQGIQCASGALVGGAISQSWNTSAVKVISGAIMPIIYNLGNSPRQNLAAAITFTTVTNVVYYYLPVHKLVAVGAGLASSFFFDMRTSGHIFTLAVLSDMASHIPNAIVNHPDAVHCVARAINFLLGGFGCFFLGVSIAKTEMGTGATLEQRAALALTLFSGGVSYLLDGVEGLRGHSYVMQKIGAVAVVLTFAYAYLKPRPAQPIRN